VISRMIIFKINDYLCKRNMTKEDKDI